MKKNWLKIIILLAIFFLHLKAPLDTDLGWHLRYGKQIFENHSVWKNNQIGFFLTGYQWAHSYSLYQLLTFTIFKYFSFGGLAVLGSLIMAASFFFILETRPKLDLLSMIGLIFIVVISLPITNLGIRSQLFSFLGLCFLYWLVVKKPLSLKTVLLLNVFFVLWANLHGGFILGLILLGLVLLEKLWRKDYSSSRTLFISLTTSSLSIIFLNPFGWRIFLEVYRHSWYPLNKLIAEWVAPNPLSLILIFSSIGAVAIVLLSRENPLKLIKRKNSFSLFFSWLLFLILAFRARRNLSFFGLSSFFLLNHLLRQNGSRLSRIILISLSFLVIVWRFFHFPQLNKNCQFVCQSQRASQPCSAAKYLQDHPESCQNIFNTYEWGGFLAWQLPHHKTFVDGRMPAWPTPENKSPYSIYLEIIQARPGFEESLKTYGADCLFIGNGTFLDLELEKNPDHLWKKIYEDKQATIYQRS